jgi:hypothetical protein
MPRQNPFSFDPTTVKRLQKLLEKDSREHNEKIAANADPLVDGVEPNVLPLDDVMTNVTHTHISSPRNPDYRFLSITLMIDCKIELHGAMNLV